MLVSGLVDISGCLTTVTFKGSLVLGSYSFCSSKTDNSQCCFILYLLNSPDFTFSRGVSSSSCIVSIDFNAHVLSLHVFLKQRKKLDPRSPARLLNGITSTVQYVLSAHLIGFSKFPLLQESSTSS